ncbi:MAG: hypothetical protein H0U71_02890 [Gammaproteobacteria bacterium]|nr:hypothetical protein [Gammaproteobacteria bacterium]
MLNLLPWRETQIQREQRYVILMLTVGVVVTAILLLGYRGWVGHKLSNLKKTNLMLERDICHQRLEVVFLKDKLKLVSAWVKRSGQFERQYKLKYILQEIAHTFPGNAYLFSLGFRENEIVMQGFLLSANSQSLKNFLDNLQKKHSIKIAVKNFSVCDVQKTEFKIVILL